MSQVAAPVAVREEFRVFGLAALQESLLFRRSAAFVIDVGIVFIANLVLAPWAIWLDDGLLLAVSALYFVLVPLLFARTLGMWLTDVVVVSDAGDKPGCIRFLIRYLAFVGLLPITLVMERSPSTIACMVNEYVAPVWLYLAALGLLPVFFSKRRRGFHEILSGTQTVPLAKWRRLSAVSATGSLVPLRIAAFLLDLTPWLLANQILSVCNVTFLFSGLALGLCLVLSTGLCGTSLGLWATGLCVRKRDHDDVPGIPRALVRFILCLGPFLIAQWFSWTAYADWSIPSQPWSGLLLCTAVLSAGAALFSRGIWGLHDRIAGTVVVPASPLTLPRFRSAVAIACALVIALDMAVVGTAAQYIRQSFGECGPAYTPGPVTHLGLRQESTDSAWPENGIQSPSDIYALYRDRIVRVDVSCIYSRWWHACTEYPCICGSGVLIANDATHGLVVTNRHVVDPSLLDRRPLKREAIANLEFTVSNPNSRYRVNAELAALYHDESGDPQMTDLALLLVPLAKWTPGAVPLASLESIRPGEDAVAIGCPQGWSFTISEGLISQLRPERNAVQISCPISPGSSGGPLVLCQGGLLAGLNTSSMQDERIQNINFAIRADLIANPKGWRYEGKTEDITRRLLGMLKVQGKDRVERCRGERRRTSPPKECSSIRLTGA